MRNMLAKLKSGEVLLGFNSMYPAEGIVERVAPDWDWVWIDGQHGQHDYRSMLAAVRAADFVGVDTVVRVPGHDPGWIGLALDMGASGIMVPQIDTVEQAREAVKAAKFAPVGARSFGGRRPIDLYGRGYAHTANDDVMLVVQIESQTAVENADEILSVDGIDAFFFGPDDMSMVEGLRMDQPRPFDKYVDTLKALAGIAQKHDVIAGGAFGTPDSARLGASLGYRLLGVGGDVGFLAGMSKNHREAMEKAIEGLEIDKPESDGSVKGSESPY